jgi:hypothetical protein
MTIWFRLRLKVKNGGNWCIVDWIDCCLTPTLAIFQLYRGVWVVFGIICTCSMLWIVFLIICTCSMCHIYWYETVRHYLPDLFHWHIHLFYTCNDLYYMWNKFRYLTCEISVFSRQNYFYTTISVLSVVPCCVTVNTHDCKLKRLNWWK